MLRCPRIAGAFKVLLKRLVWVSMLVKEIRRLPKIQLHSHVMTIYLNYGNLSQIPSVAQ